MLFALSVLSAHALTCAPGGADPICDAAAEMIDAANTAHPGSSPVFDGARGAKDENRVLTRLRGTLDTLTAGGCLTEPTFDDWVAGAYGPSSSGFEATGDPISVSFTRAPKMFTAVGEATTFGDEFGTYNKQTQLVGDYSRGDYTYGFWVRVRGSRGVFFAFAGTCDGPETAGAALRSTYAGDVSALDVEVMSELDGICSAEGGDPDCNGICEFADSADGDDCDGVCGTFDFDDSVDCNGMCDIGDSADGNDCDGACTFDDEPGSADCDGFCDPEDSPASDCDEICDIGDGIPSFDCDGFCGDNDVIGSIDCLFDPCESNPFLPECSDECGFGPFGPPCMQSCNENPFQEQCGPFCEQNPAECS